jgi:hypothetical protein
VGGPVELWSNRTRNQHGVGWVFAHQLDVFDHILYVHVRVRAGQAEERYAADKSGHPTGPRLLP